MTDKEQASATIIFIRGIPGSGKSFAAENLKRSVLGKNVTLLDPDFIDTSDTKYKELSTALTAEGINNAIHPFRWLRQQAIVKAQDNSVIIWNQPFTDEGVFDRLVSYLQTEIEKK